MLEVELVYETVCPHVEATRTLLLRALIEAGLPVAWREWELSNRDCPHYVINFKSPTVVINGKGFFQPSKAELAIELKNANRCSKGILTLLSGIMSGIIVFFPKAACPA